jgi:hypothetical protein
MPVCDASRYLVSKRVMQVCDARSPHARFDWDQRDRQLSEQVRRVALELHAAEPDRRIKLFQIHQRLPELKAKLFKMDRLPLSRRALYAVLGKS